MIDVFLRQALDYEQAGDLIPDLLRRILPKIQGARLLIKPNFVAQRNAIISCTHPSIIAASARYCLEQGATVAVGDSPAFGTAQAIARTTGLERNLQALGIDIITLTAGRRVRSGAVEVPVSKQALEADLILNLPKFKAHSQMLLTGAVKNLFGCVTGVNKAWLHAHHGDKGTLFAEMISGLLQALPPVYSLLDGVVAMHRTGPINGDPYLLRFLGASRSAVALDTAAAMTLGLESSHVPIWECCRTQRMPGSEPADLAFPQLAPTDFPASDFQLPASLKPESFRPDVLLRSMMKRWWMSRFSA